MIDLARDDLISIDQARELWPGPVKPCWYTVFRAHKCGLRGECLETVKVGCALYTTEACVRDFLERTCRIKLPLNGARAKGKAKRRSVRRAKRVLDKAGI